MTEPVTDDARILDDRYQLLDRLGSGGMGAVHRAHDRLLDRAVAIKILHDQTGDDAVRRARLRAEARFAGALRHPGIVQVYDYGEESGPGGVTPYVVMELVAGRPLSTLVREEGQLPSGRVAALIADVADALATAHAAGIVHRDLKPSNILVTDAGTPVLLDFGIARSDDTDPLTTTGEIIGTADYLSPEQVRGQRATGASDVYALGVLAHQCLTGTSPFHRETHVATALAHLNDAPPHLPASVPASLRALVREMLDGEPDRRPDAVEVARRASSLEAVPHLVQPPAQGLRRPRAVSIALAAAIAIVAGVFVVVITGRDPAAPPAVADLAVPSVRGEQVRAARAELRAAGFAVAVRRVHGSAPADRVLSQRPAPGPYSGNDDPATVTLRVASGWVPVDTDGLVGQPYDEAAARLADAGLEPVRAEQPSTSTPGSVLSVSPAGLVPLDGTVTLTVAAAPATTAPKPKAKAPKGPAKGHGQGKANGKAKGKAKGHGPKHGR